MINFLNIHDNGMNDNTNSKKPNKTMQHDGEKYNESFELIKS